MPMDADRSPVHWYASPRITPASARLSSAGSIVRTSVIPASMVGSTRRPLSQSTVGGVSPRCMKWVMAYTPLLTASAAGQHGPPQRAEHGAAKEQLLDHRHDEGRGQHAQELPRQLPRRARLY